jgi:hypothetical protein
MTNEPHSLALLRWANPVSVNTEDASSPQAAGLFAEIVAQPRTRRGSGRWPGDLGLRARVAVGGAGIGAVAAAVIVAVFSGSTAAPAFAGWTAKPTAAVSQQIRNAARDCRLSGPVLVETRGPYTAAVFASRYGGTACVIGPGMSFEGSVGGVRAPDNRFKPNQIGMAVSTGGDDQGHGFTVLTGRVGTAVRSVVIHRSYHGNVVASIKGGWYLAWWPAGTRATYATVTTTSGSHRVALPTLATNNPSCDTRLPSRLKGQPHPHSVGCAAAGGTSFPNSVGKSNGPGSDGVPGPPMVGQIVGEPFHGTVLFNVWNATSVLVCFHPPADLNAAMQPKGPTGPCTHATLLTRLPPQYPVQKNLLELFPKSLWETSLPAKSRNPETHRFLVIPHGPWGDGPRSELMVTR